MTDLQVQQWNLHLLDELVVSFEEPLRFTFLTGGLEYLLSSLGDSR